MPRLTLTAALLLAALSCPAQAQSPADHEGHHPEQGQAAPAGPGERQGMMRSGNMMGMMMGRGAKDRGMVGGGAMVSPVMFRLIFALMDADGDGTISLAEFQSAYERIFRAMDSNKDGKLTREEMIAFMHGTKGEMPQMPQH
jgi:hypothetical protein